MRFARCCILIQVLIAFCTPSRAALIDPFEEGPFSLTSPGTLTQNGLSTVIGGQRVVKIDILNSSATLALSAADDSAVFHSTGTGEHHLIYGNTTPLNADLTAGSATAILVRLASATTGSSIQLTLTDASSHSSTVSRSYVTSTAEQDLLYPFSSFSTVNPVNIAKISFFMRTTTNGSFSLTQIDTNSVPEPSTALLVLSATSLLLRRRVN